MRAGMRATGIARPHEEVLTLVYFTAVIVRDKQRGPYQRIYLAYVCDPKESTTVWETLRLVSQ